ncbi:transcriptional regulator [Bernardetia litoralis DSM 6794]|uniref:Transcriptional regulator n=1 Tax=Bernardetia litoralis (strain ATCC 23117 / DSM 6794 / NBRC 15988 / NCIMB 1366 / Fx l1 / Sio-4) TaxID=880071 RepID=I4AHV5_BERLS|nr:TetR/AcrR family transcriptional regulator [Bernardetia litoralis]AFM03540.1 transcriptional regulator [Bernardetia litoralis DSM 6794]
MGIAERKARERLHRRNAIVDAAEDVIFKYGFSVATMAQVAKAAELSKGTLYLYFRSKEELYRAIILRGFVILKKMLREATKEGDSGYDKVIIVGKTYVEFSEKYPNYFTTILDYQNDTFNLASAESESLQALEEGNVVITILVKAIREGVKDGSITEQGNPFETAFVLWSQFTGVLQVVKRKINIIEHYFSLTKEDLLTTHWRMVERMLK